MPDRPILTSSSLPESLIKAARDEMRRRAAQPVGTFITEPTPSRADLAVQPGWQMVWVPPYTRFFLGDVETPVQYQSGGRVWKQAIFVPETGVLSIGVGLGDYEHVGPGTIVRPLDEEVAFDGYMNRLTVQGEMSHVIALPSTGTYDCTVSADITVPNGKLYFDALWDHGSKPADEEAPFIWYRPFMPSVQSYISMRLLGTQTTDESRIDLGTIRWDGSEVRDEGANVMQHDPYATRAVTLEVRNGTSLPSGVLVVLVSVTLIATVPPRTDAFLQGRHVSACFDMIQPGVTLDPRFGNAPIRLYETYRHYPDQVRFGAPQAPACPPLRLDALRVNATRIELG